MVSRSPFLKRRKSKRCEKRKRERDNDGKRNNLTAVIDGAGKNGEEREIYSRFTSHIVLHILESRDSL